jgi:hypothetical protein
VVQGVSEQAITNNAVVFFDSNNIVAKEMLYTEFEAVLDHIVGVPDFQGQKINAVYLHINQHLQVIAAVFFQVAFDSKGYTDKNWNIPLEHLAGNAGSGPNLGAGQIKLSCKSQCSVEWHQHEMWNPDPDHKVFRRLKAVVKRNRLSLPCVEKIQEDTSGFSTKTANAPGGHERRKASGIEINEELKQRLSDNFKQELKQRTHEVAGEYKLKMASLKSEAQEHIEKIHKQYREENSKLVETLDVAKQLFSEEKQKNIKLKETLEKEAELLHAARESFQQELGKDNSVNTQKLAELEAKFELELHASLETATAELKERLEMREVELFYRDEKLTSLREDVALLRQEKMALQDESGDKLIQRMSEQGINFIIHNAGQEPITLPAASVGEYLESQAGYMAKFYEVDTEAYEHWLRHYELPVCNHKIAGGDVCGQPVEKITKPTQFIVNKSDRCSTHGSLNDAIITMMKMRDKA